VSDVRLIDANALDGHKFPAYGATLDARERGWNECIEYLKARAKTVDAAPVVHARWEDDHMDYKCSACGTSFHDDMFWIQGDCIAPKYCPNCGAKMDGGAE
jgi:DNA-directed RNA polymerase subunit RPC12/RpoP